MPLLKHLGKLTPPPALLLAVIALLAVAGGRNLQGTIIPIDLGSSGLSFDITVPFSDLNATTLHHQTASLDFTFTGDHFVRLFTVTTAFEAAVTLDTSASGSAGSLKGTGFLKSGANPVHAPQDLGSASFSNGDMAVGLFPPADLARPVDFSGVHFDLTFPDNPSVEVTGGRFRLLVLEGGPFGIGPGVPTDMVPDVGGTLLLLTVGLAGLLAIRVGCLCPPDHC
jgi:hypothetical protein